MRSLDKRLAVAKFIYKELERFYVETQSNKLIRDEDIPKFKTKKDLADYFFKYGRFVDSEKQNDSADADALPKGVETVANSTVIKAINFLITEGFIHKVDGYFCYKPNLETNRNKFPILSIASKVDITINVPDNILFLSVPCGLTESLASYLSAVFHKGDILFLPMGASVMCVNVSPKALVDGEESLKGKHGDVTSADWFRFRIESVLREFNCRYPEFEYMGTYEMPYTLRHDPVLRETLRSMAKITAEENVPEIHGEVSAQEIYTNVKAAISFVPKAMKDLSTLERDARSGFDGDEDYGEPIVEEIEAFSDDRFDDLF